MRRFLKDICSWSCNICHAGPWDEDVFTCQHCGSPKNG